MQFILTAGWDPGIATLSERLNSELADGKKVLWMTCGGSNILAAVQVMDKIPYESTPNLTIMLSDERYGAVGHADSNWEQLQQAGFNPWQAKTLPVLQENLNLEETVANYSRLVEQAFTNNDIVIAQLGIGPDGHTAGILPKSLATSDTTVLAAGYESPPLTRVTLTFAGLRHINAAYVFAFGSTKQAVLRQLQSQALPLIEQPSQILKELAETYVYNDQIGEAA